MQEKLFVAKVLWTFDVVKVLKQLFDLENTLLHYGFLAKPELRVRFVRWLEKRSNAVWNKATPQLSN